MLLKNTVIIDTGNVNIGFIWMHQNWELKYHVNLISDMCKKYIHEN